MNIYNLYHPEFKVPILPNSISSTFNQGNLAFIISGDNSSTFAPTSLNMHSVKFKKIIEEIHKKDHTFVLDDYVTLYLRHFL